MKMIRVHMAVWVVLLAGGFLLGFVPEYRKNRELETKLQDPQKLISALQLQVQLSEVRDLASLMLQELSRQNYGLARDYSDKYYSKLKDLMETVQDPTLKKSLEELAATRDSLVPALISSNATSLATAQPIVTKTFEVTRKAN
jgi:hypothetical protein